MKSKTSDLVANNQHLVNEPIFHIRANVRSYHDIVVVHIWFSQKQLQMDQVLFHRHFSDLLDLIDSNISRSHLIESLYLDIFSLMNRFHNQT